MGGGRAFDGGGGSNDDDGNKNECAFNSHFLRARTHSSPLMGVPLLSMFQGRGRSQEKLSNNAKTLSQQMRIQSQRLWHFD